jgi:general secretion pathway protein C
MSHDNARMSIPHVNQHTQVPSAKLPTWVAIGLWAATAAGCTAWVLALWPKDESSVATVSMEPMSSVQSTPSDQADFGKVLGQQPALAAPETTAATDSNLVLLGIAKAGNSEAVALLSVDGQPAKAVKRGSEVQPGLVLQSVSLNEVRLGNRLNGPSSRVLPMPQLADAAEKKEALKK